MLPVIIALDFVNQEQALDLLHRSDPALCRVKIGKGMFTRFGPGFVRNVMALGFEVFLDLKFHDIPNTVYDACRAASDLGVWMLNIHALGGEEMMSRAREAVEGSSTHLIAVTLLTSMNEAQLKQLQCTLLLSEMVLLLAKSTKNAGLDGVVASSHEVLQIKQQLGKEFLTVTPGIRLETDSCDDQKRVMTPSQALQNGSDYLVIGRSITKAEDPMAKLAQIRLDIANRSMK